MKFKVPKPKIPDVGKMGQYEGFNGDQDDFKTARKKILRYLLGSLAVLVVLSVVIVMNVRSDSSEEQSNDGASTETQTSTSPEMDEADEREHDQGIGTEERTFTDVRGNSIVGAYDPKYYDLNVRISEELARKYSSKFEYYFIVLEDDSEEDGFWMSSRGSDSVFQVRIDGDGGVSDNLYSSKYMGIADTQRWSDMHGEKFHGYIDVLVDRPTSLISGGGVEGANLDELQLRSSPDIIILVEDEYRGGDEVVSDMFTEISENAGYRYLKEFSVSVVELNSMDGLYDHLYEKQDLTHENYQDLLDVGIVHHFTVTTSGKAT